MKLPRLTQRIVLDRHQAQPLLQALVQVRGELLRRNPDERQRLTTTEALSLKPLTKLIKVVGKCYERDRQPVPGKRPPRPHRFQLEYDELATVRLYYAQLLATCPEPAANDSLATVLGRFHQPSLNLESHIALVPPNGPGVQGLLF